MVTSFSVPPSQPRSSTFGVRIDGVPAEVHSTGVADFVILEGDGPFTLEVALPSQVRAASVRPARLGVAAEIDGALLRCAFLRPVNASVEAEGVKPLFLFACHQEAAPVSPDSPGVRFFGGRRVHDEGLVRLRSGETLYVEGGSVLRASVIAEDAENVRICGRGVIDGTDIGQGVRPVVLLSHCRDCRIEDVTMVRPTNWMTVLGDCDRVLVDNIHEIGEVVCSDGVDIVGSRDIEVRNSFLVNNDDCVVVKAMPRSYQNVTDRNWGRDVRGVRIHGSSFLNLGAGNAMEIGFELRSDIFEDVAFEDIDVLAAHQNAAVFSIHNGDHAVVRRIRYRDIRVEHYWNKLVDIRILRSRYSRDSEPGRVEDVVFERIRCIPNVFNTPSIIGGLDSGHRVSGVVFRDFRIGDAPVRSADDLQLYTNQAEGISFE